MDKVHTAATQFLPLIEILRKLGHGWTPLCGMASIFVGEKMCQQSLSGCKEVGEGARTL